MKKMKHTPGPWIVVERQAFDPNPNLLNPNFARFWIGAAETKSQGPIEIATVAGKKDGEIPANAHLIAAAPEMLEALRLAQFYIEKAGIFRDGETYPAVVNAIAKAEGERRMKHTPGPWVSGYVESGWGLISKESGTCIVFTEKMDGGTVPTDADARLLAAAPELLIAAKWATGFCVSEILKLIERQRTKPDIGENDPKYLQIFIDEWERIRKECQAAITKAEGEE